jgi:Cellulose binding domain
VEAGFELWQGGAGLATNSFSVSINGSNPSPSPSTINSLWNGSYTQSGNTVKVTNASYNGSLAPGATATVGFTATGTSGSPSSVSCT